jgi:hypothetical protein
MQDVPQVGWDPRYIDLHLPWAHRLLVVYLFVVIATSAVKSASILRQLLPFTSSSLRAPKGEHHFLRAWEKCSNRIQSMKRIVIITLLLSVLTAVYLSLEYLGDFVTQKIFFPGAFFGSMIEVLSVFALGILSCTVIYIACAFLEGALLRRMESWRYARGTNNNQTQSASESASLS